MGFLLLQHKLKFYHLEKKKIYKTDEVENIFWLYVSKMCLWKSCSCLYEIYMQIHIRSVSHAGQQTGNQF